MTPVAAVAVPVPLLGENSTAVLGRHGHGADAIAELYRGLGAKTAL